MFETSKDVSLNLTSNIRLVQECLLLTYKQVLLGQGVNYKCFVEGVLTSVAAGINCRETKGRRKLVSSSHFNLTKRGSLLLTFLRPKFMNVCNKLERLSLEKEPFQSTQMFVKTLKN